MFASKKQLIFRIIFENGHDKNHQDEELHPKKDVPRKSLAAIERAPRLARKKEGLQSALQGLQVEE